MHENKTDKLLAGIHFNSQTEKYPHVLHNQIQKFAA